VENIWAIEEGAEGWIILHNEELQNSYVSPNVTKEIKSSKTKWAGCAARIDEVRNS